MRHLLYSVVFIAVLIASPSYAQKPPIKFGDVTMEELAMTRYEGDSSASAVILVDYGDANIDLGLMKMVYERITRIKILKKDGFDHANVEVPLFHTTSSKETLSGLKAATYDLVDGKMVVTKMSSDAVFQERVNKYKDFKKFTLPNVKEGSVIEYTYKVYSDFWTNFPNWEFQSTAPTKYSEFRARIPEYFHYQQFMQGYVRISDYTREVKPQQDYSSTMHRWTVKDVPAFIPEPFMSGKDAYISRINFALSSIIVPGRIHEDWGCKVTGGLAESEYFGKLIQGSGFLKDKVAELTAGITEPEKKIAAIMDYVKASIEWNEEDDYSADETTLKKVFEAKKGNAAEINLALVCMLQKAGIDAEPVLISTKDHGPVREPFAMVEQFNYTIVLVNLGEKQLLLDATDRMLPMDLIPERGKNGRGLAIAEKVYHWVNLDVPAKSKTTTQVTMQLKPDLSLEGKIEYTYAGYDARDTRKAVKDLGKEEFVKKRFASKSCDIKESEVKNFESLQESLIEAHTVAIEDHVNETGGVVYIDPFIVARTLENPFKLEKRIYPIDFGNAFDRVYILNLTLPEGYQVDELPETKAMMLPKGAGRYMYNVTNNGNVITITSMMSINKAIFVQDEYPILREFYNLMIAKQTEQIVLKKI